MWRNIWILIAAQLLIVRVDASHFWCHKFEDGQCIAPGDADVTLTTENKAKMSAFVNAVLSSSWSATASGELVDDSE